VDVKKRKIWEKQVLIPHKLEGEVYAFSGPLPLPSTEPNEMDQFFPCHAPLKPRIFVNSSFDMSFMKPENRVLRSAPAPSKDYVAWLDKVQNKQGLFW
jgi:hypothetical protein